MRPLRALAVVAACGVGAAVSAAAPVGVAVPRKPAVVPLPAQSELAVERAKRRGPFVYATTLRGRPLTVFGTAGAGRTVLVAGCPAAVGCTGREVIRVLGDDCPPPDADLWLLPRRTPGAFRQALAAARPDTAILFQTGRRAVVRAAGPGVAPGRGYARFTGLSFEEHAGDGLAGWSQSALAGSGAVTVVLPPGRLGRLEARRHAYAIARLARTRFAQPVRPVGSERLGALVPSGWHAASRPLTRVVEPAQRLALATFPLTQRRPDPGCAPVTAHRRLRQDEAFIFLFEYRASGSPDAFPPRPRRFELGRRGRSKCFGDSYVVRFRERGRHFQAHVSLGPQTSQWQRRQVLDVLDSLQVKA